MPLSKDDHGAEEPTKQPAAERLESWKEIAAYLKRDIRTVQRWEKRERLPVDRHIHDKLGTVYAYRGEVDAWWNNRRPRLEARAKVSGARTKWLGWVAAGVVALVAVGLVWRLAADRAMGTQDRSEMVMRRVWVGPDLPRLGTVSPDGRYLAYAEPVAQNLAVRDLKAGGERHLTQKPPRAVTGGAQTPAFSPDGKQIAYAWDEGFFQDLRVVGIDGSGERVLHHDVGVVAVREIEWSPDGGRVLALLQTRDRTNQIALVSVTDGSVRVLKTLDWRDPWKMSFSSDGRYIAYDFPPDEKAPQRDLFVLAVGGNGSATPVVEHPANELLLGWAPDGRTILFLSDRTGTMDAWIARVVDGKPQGAPVMVKKDLGLAWPMGFTRNGSYYYGLQTGMTDVYVARLEAASIAAPGKPAGAATPVADRMLGSNRSPDWSPDGRFLAYVAQRLRGPGPRLVIRPVEGEGEREVEVDLNMADLLRWGPDGRSLVVTGYDKANRLGVFRVAAETGDATPVILGHGTRTYFHEAMLSPDGKTLFYKLRDGGIEPGRLVARDLESGREKEVLASVYRFCLSRDGRRLAYSSFDDAWDFIRVMPADGGEARDVFRQRRPSGRIVSLAWTADMRWMLFARRGELWRVPAEGGTPEKVGLAMEDLRELRVHSDGRRIAFTAGKGKSEVWVMENFLPKL